MDIFKQFATNEKLEVEGTWFDLGEGARIKVGRQGNKAYSKLLTREFDRNKRLLDQKNDAATAKGEEIMIDIMARTILLGWEGIEFDGKPLEHSVDNAKRLLAIKDFRQQVSEFAQDVASFRDEAEAEALGN